MEAVSTTFNTYAKQRNQSLMNHWGASVIAYLPRLAILILVLIVLFLLAFFIQEARVRLQQEPKEILAEARSVLASAKRSVELVEKELPEILTKARQSANAAKQLAEDVHRLHGILDGHGLMTMAEKLLQSVKESGGEVAAKPLTALQKSNWQPATEWADGELNEIQAMVVLGRIRNNKELLERLSKTAVTGREWKLKIMGVETSMADWLRQHFADWKNQIPESVPPTSGNRIME